MANDNNKIKDLVHEDDDATAEFDIPTFPHQRDGNGLETGEKTCDFADEDSAHDTRAETIERLQFDIEQLRARWMGLETEIKAREEITQNLQRELDDRDAELSRKRSLIKKRDATIKSLKTEIRDRDERYRQLETERQELEARLDERSREFADAQSQSRAGKSASDADEVRTLRKRLAQAEEYADTIRHQLSDLRESSQLTIRENRELIDELAEATARIEELSDSALESRETIDGLNRKLEARDAEHQEEIRTLRFELGEAQETVATSEIMSEQLAADLVDTRGYKEELERMLSSTEEQNRARIDELEKEVEKLQLEVGDYEEKLSAKSEVIRALMDEIADKSRQLESIDDIEQVIQDIDDRMSERIDLRAPRDRVTRLLVGKIDDQLLRFPLFKDRLTIGRAGENDIQLKAQFISRRHAVVLTDGDMTRVIDWGSKNGVFVNKKRVTEHFLTNGDIVTIGTADFRYEERAKRD